MQTEPGQAEPSRAGPGRAGPGQASPRSANAGGTRRARLSRYDVIVAGGRHTGLAPGAHLAEAGQSVLVLERLRHTGGLAVSAAAFPGVPARVSRYSYLVSLLPSAIARDLGLRVELRQRRIGC